MDIAVATAFEAIAERHLDDDCLVYRERRLTWREARARSRRLANALLGAGLGCRVERQHLAGHASGQDHLGICLRNSNEYLESMIGALMARAAPFNINYRFTAAEMRRLLMDTSPAALVIQSDLTPLLAQCWADLPSVPLVLQVADDSGLGLMPGAVWYEDVLAGAPAGRPAVTPSPDDLYILCTGGTSGAPKAVLWRNGDARVACFGGAEAASLGDVVAAATAPGDPTRVLIAPPLAHGAAQWMSMSAWGRGGTVLLPWNQRQLDPDAVWRQIETERVTSLLVVGDAFARPLVEQLDRDHYDLDSLNVVLSGGASLSPAVHDGFRRHLPWVVVVDGLGSSEAGGQLVTVAAGAAPRPGRFPLAPGNVVLSADRTRVLSAVDGEIGWLARTGRLALGYLGDADLTARTFPIIDGVRYAVPGDRASHRGERAVFVHGRDASTINTGGEKVFAEEVEAVLREHPAVYDCIVTSRPSQRWGQEVVGLVEWRADSSARASELLRFARQRLAGFKVPKAVVTVTAVRRSAAGKADYRWAAGVAEAGHD